VQIAVAVERAIQRGRELAVHRRDD
jgi:hypothetical protein